MQSVSDFGGYAVQLSAVKTSPRLAAPTLGSLKEGQASSAREFIMESYACSLIDPAATRFRGLQIPNGSGKINISMESL